MFRQKGVKTATERFVGKSAKMYCVKVVMCKKRMYLCSCMKDETTSIHHYLKEKKKNPPIFTNAVLAQVVAGRKQQKVSQNHRVAQVGMDLNKYLSPNPLPWAGLPLTRSGWLRLHLTKSFIQILLCNTISPTSNFTRISGLYSAMIPIWSEMKMVGGKLSWFTYSITSLLFHVT